MGCDRAFWHHPRPIGVLGRLQITGLGGRSNQVATLNEAHRTIFELPSQVGHPLALREIRADLPESASVRNVKRALARLKELKLAASPEHGVSARWRRNGVMASWDESFGAQ